MKAMVDAKHTKNAMCCKTDIKTRGQAEAVMKMNPSLNIKCYSTRVGPDTEELFDDDFFEALDGVCNALDNVQVCVCVCVQLTCMRAFNSSSNA
jgi:hypothetical protein